MVSDRNRRVFESAQVGSEYAKLSTLRPPERAILEKYRSDLAGRRILDLGVGAGRTIPFLLELSEDYVGTDYSAEMIGRCRRRFPGVRLEIVDARDLSCFETDAFDFVLFSFNGIDCVGHDDRLKILGEVRRVLKSGGTFVFSSHNRNRIARKAWDPAHLKINPLRHPVRLAKKLVAFPVGILNALVNARHNERQGEYCVLSDPAHRYSLMLYAIGIDEQRKQLDRAGFSDIEVVSLDGHWLSDDDRSSNVDKFVYYVCRRM